MAIGLPSSSTRRGGVTRRRVSYPRHDRAGEERRRGSAASGRFPATMRTESPRARAGVGAAPRPRSAQPGGRARRGRRGARSGTIHGAGSARSRIEHPQGASTSVSPFGAESRWTSSRSPGAVAAWVTWVPSAGPSRRRRTWPAPSRVTRTASDTSSIVRTAPRGTMVGIMAGGIVAHWQAAGRGGITPSAETASTR